MDEELARLCDEIDALSYVHRWKRAKPAKFPVGAPMDPTMVKAPRG